jgi:hypothetical protein
MELAPQTAFACGAGFQTEYLDPAVCYFHNGQPLFGDRLTDRPGRPVSTENGAITKRSEKVFVFSTK